MLMGSLAGAKVVGAEAPREHAVEPLTRAERLFFLGQQLYDAGKIRASLEIFHNSYAAYASPNSHLYIARCLRDLGHRAEAYAEYKSVLLEAAEAAEPDRYTMTLQAATLERAALRPRLGVLRLEVFATVPGLEIKLASRRVAVAEWSQPHFVDPGTVTVSATAPGRLAFLRNYEISAGEQRTVRIELGTVEVKRPARAIGVVDIVGVAGTEFAAEPSEPPWPPWRVVAVSSAGLGTVGFALWGAFGLKAASRYDRLEAQCGGACGRDYPEEIASGRRETLISQIAFGVGAVGIAGGLAAYWWGRRARPETTAGLELGPSRALCKWGGTF
jgi:hypothetical protein